MVPAGARAGWYTRPAASRRGFPTLYESWYGFREKPFNLTPDPKYLYLSPRHAEAVAHLEFGHRERGGFIVITGEVGTGKTTLARYFLSKLGPDTRTAVVLYPALTAEELLRAILDDLRVTAESPFSKMGLVDALHRFLVQARAEGRNVVLLIDEAQDLSTEVLEQVRLISNLETDTEKLIQIVLIGQSELRDLLARHELRQLAQRVTARYHLSPLSLAETREYVRHRVVVAGGEGKVGFTSDALSGIHRLSGGVPRLVNLVCDRSLLAGFVKGSRTVTAAMVKQAGAEVAMDRPAPALRWHHGLIATGLTLGLALLAFAVAPRLAQAPEAPGTGDRPAAAVTAVPPKPVLPSPRSDRLDAILRTAPRQASFASAAAYVQEAWGRRVLSRTALRTHLGRLRALDLPVVLEMFHPSRRDTCFVALLGLDGRTATVGAADAPQLETPLDQVDELWTKDAVVWWPEPADVGRDDARREAWARRALSALGYDEPELRAAVGRFQEAAGLVPDGVPGPRTRMALYALAPGERPRLVRSGARP